MCRAELVLAIPLLAMGVFLIFSKRAESLRNLSLISILIGVLIILIPTVLIGVCGSAMMICNAVMKPALILLGTLVIALGIAGVLEIARVLRAGPHIPEGGSVVAEPDILRLVRKGETAPGHHLT